MGEQSIRPIAVGANEAAMLLDISKPTLYRISNRADFHAKFRIGNRTLFSVSGLEEWVQLQTEGGAHND